jgi:hypothetical protein
MSAAGERRHRALAERSGFAAAANSYIWPRALTKLDEPRLVGMKGEPEALPLATTYL